MFPAQQSVQLVMSWEPFKKLYGSRSVAQVPDVNHCCKASFTLDVYIVPGCSTVVRCVAEV